MTFIPPDYAEIVFHVSLANDPEDMLTTIGIAVSDVPTPDDLTDFMADRGWTTFFQGAMTEDYEVTRVVALVGQDGGPPLSVEQTFSIAGSTTTDPVTSNTSLLVKKTTGLGGRANRGRMYVPGPPAAKVAPNGTIEATFRGDRNDDLQAIITASPAIPFGPYFVLHGLDTDVPTEITNLVLETVVATQRRRLRP